ncbi:MOSC domain protein [Aspergillus sp. HF37]|nr:MOSC domain protein [Aspergillus sp. HF37]
MLYTSCLAHAATILTAPAIYILCIIPALAIFLYSQQHPARPRGCRRLGLPPGKTNLHDEYDPKYTGGVPSGHLGQDGQPSWRVKALFTYPIKSCAGLELEAADAASTGLAYDRQFCFAEYVAPSNPGDARNARWDLRTLRDGRFSKLALVRPEIWVPDPSARDYEPGMEERGLGNLEKLGTLLGLVSPQLSFRVPLSPPDHNAYPSGPVTVWKDRPVAYDYGRHIPLSFRDFVLSGRPLTLFRVHPCHHREIFRNAPRKEQLGFQPVTGFADAYPIHLLNLASVRDVASRCVTTIPDLSIRRFRSNIVVQGPTAFEEDHWKRIRLRPQGSPNRGSDDDGKAVDIHTVCRTVRCRLPNVDPATGVRHPSEPDGTLKSYRRIDAGSEMNACLGMQLVPAVQEFTVRVGDSITVLETGEHFYIKMLGPGERVGGE